VGVGDDPGRSITGRGVGSVGSTESVGFGDMGSGGGRLDPVVGHSTGSGGDSRRVVGSWGGDGVGSLTEASPKRIETVVRLVQKSNRTNLCECCVVVLFQCCSVLLVSLYYWIIV